MQNHQGTTFGKQVAISDICGISEEYGASKISFALIDDYQTDGSDIIMNFGQSMEHNCGLIWTTKKLFKQRTWSEYDFQVICVLMAYWRQLGSNRSSVPSGEVEEVLLNPRCSRLSESQHSYL